jgi:GNAT superfamily N-acetyltransferase
VAAPADARELRHLRTAVAKDMTLRFGEGEWSAAPSEAAVLRQLRASRVLVARQREQIVGNLRLITAMPWAFDSSAFTRVSTALYVLGLAVSPDAQGQGIGSQLMQAARDATITWPAEALWLDAYDHPAGAGAFYRRCGFREVGTTHFGKIPLRYFEWLAPVTET